MSRVRLIALGVLAAFAVGAVASASSASADTCGSGSHFVFCNDNNVPLVGKEVLGKSGLALLAGILGGLEARFHCESDDYKATLGELGASTGKILFLGCKEEKPKGCKLTAADEAQIEAQFAGETNSATAATYTGNKNTLTEEFATLHIESAPGETCVTPGEFPVTGKQKVETPLGGSQLSEHEIIAKKSGSSLKLGGQTASFSSATKNAHLASGLAWAILAGE